MDSNPQQSASSQPRRSRRLQQLGPGIASPRRRRTQAKVTVSSSDPVGSDEKNTEDVAEDDLCPICSLLLYRPVTTRCGHTMCEACMAHWADVSVAQHMTIVDIDEEPVAFDPVSGLEAKCPMCRTQTTASFNSEMARRLERDYPKTWAELKQESEEDGEGMGSIQTITVYIGNRHNLVQSKKDHEDGRSNQHEWDFFVRPSRTDFVEEVQILLHPTFRPSKVIRQRSPYEISRLGWGTFTLTAYVVLKAGYSWVSSEAEDTPDGAAKGMLPLEWTLDFEGFGGKGSMGRTKLKVKSDREWEGVDGQGARDDAEWERTVRQYQRDGRFEMEEEE